MINCECSYAKERLKCQICHSLLSEHLEWLMKLSASNKNTFVFTLTLLSVLPSSISGIASSGDDTLDDVDMNINVGDSVGRDKTSLLLSSGTSHLVFFSLFLLSAVHEL